MATSQLSAVIQHLRRMVPLRDRVGLTDGQLLEDYLGRREQAALAVLVRRHGPMVWGVCRRILGNDYDAEDAFQSTFLVLVRRAGSIAAPELLANWLFGVARRTALKARATTAKRRTREKQVTVMPEPVVTEQALWNDVQPLLDQELSQLPDKYRVAIILCNLEGKSQGEAARQLNVPAGTLAARVARGRRLLAKQLARHGLGVSEGVLAAVLAEHAVAAVPTAVESATLRAAGVLASGPAAAAGVISARVAALTEGGLRSMGLMKLLIAAAASLLVLGGGVWALSRVTQPLDEQVHAGPGPAARPEDTVPPAPNPSVEPADEAQRPAQPTFPTRKALVERKIGATKFVLLPDVKVKAKAEAQVDMVFSTGNPRSFLPAAIVKQIDARIVGRVELKADDYTLASLALSGVNPHGQTSFAIARIEAWDLGVGPPGKQFDVLVIDAVEPGVGVIGRDWMREPTRGDKNLIHTPWMIYYGRLQEGGQQQAPRRP